jgi:hypothetical protein
MLRFKIARNWERPVTPSIACDRLGGCGLKISLGELPPAARLLQIRRFELHRDLTQNTQARPNKGTLTAQVGNCSDISFATQHYPINEVVC